MSLMEWYGGDVIKSVERAKEVALTAACEVVVSAAKPLINIVTGALTGSIAYEVKGDEGRIGTNIEYGPYVEMGTVKMSARPYLRPALDNNRAKINKMFGEALGAAAEAGGRR